MNFDKELRAVNEIAYLKQEIKKLKLLLRKIAGMQRNYVCRYCGKQLNLTAASVRTARILINATNLLRHRLTKVYVWNFHTNLFNQLFPFFKIFFMINL